MSRTPSMRAPEFWWQPKPNLAARLLSPLGSIYGAITARRMARGGWRSPLPVLCIGNFIAGGAGKTPTAIAIARHLLAHGEKPVFLSRGYRGTIRTPCEVNLALHSARDVGDEAMLLAQVAPVIIGADRIASAKRAEAIGASLLILDDGLQNPSLFQDFRLAVVDAKIENGNGLCLPAGPMRAPLSGQLGHISAALFIGKAEQAKGMKANILAHGKTVLTAKLVAEKQVGDSLASRKVFAFAGIGLPEKLRATLEDLGADITGWRSFADHHVYSRKELLDLQSEAGRQQADLVTTEKDFVRIMPLIESLDQTLPMPKPLPVKLVFDDPDRLDAILLDALNAARRR